MHYTFTTPPASRAAERPTPIDDALVADARRLLGAAVVNRPPTGMLDRRGMQALFAAPMTTLCVDGAARGVPIEKLIVAIKLAWASMIEARLSFAEGAPDPLSAAVTACIEAYFQSARKAD